MTTYNTGNPIGSASVKDLYDNAENLDVFVNSKTATTHPDRLGVPRKTYYGIEQDAQAVLESAEAIRDSAEAVRDSLGFFPPVDYASGLSVEATNFTVNHEGVVYAAQPGAVPFTTGAWDAQQWYPLQNIYNEHNLLVFESFAEASAAAATLPDGQVVTVTADESRGGRSTINTTQGGELVFVDFSPNSVTVAGYDELLAYAGRSSIIDVVGVLGTEKPSGIAGRFLKTNRAGAVTDGGTVFVLPNGDVFERDYKGSIRASWFGAKLDGVTHDQVAMQKAVNACKAAGWASLCIDGYARIGASLIVDRQVDTNANEWVVHGEGAEAGFLVDNGVTLFDSTLAMPSKDPVSEFIAFNDLHFKAAAYWDESFVLSKKFLRIKFNSCFFWLLRCQASATSYSQTLHFNMCNIRNNRPGFIDTKGSYDLLFIGGVIENGGTIVKSVDTEVGTSGLRFIGPVIEGLQSSTVIATGVSGFVLQGCHLESNVANDFNFWAGTLQNGSITVSGNYIYNPNGTTFLHGGTHMVMSGGNKCFPSILHEGAARVDSLVSMADDATTLAEIPPTFEYGGVRVFGGRGFGVGISASATTTARFLAHSGDTRILETMTSGGVDAFYVDVNRNVASPGIKSAANDTAAATAGVPLGGFYHEGGNVRVRLT